MSPRSALRSLYSERSVREVPRLGLLFGFHATPRIHRTSHGVHTTWHHGCILNSGGTVPRRCWSAPEGVPPASHRRFFLPLRAAALAVYIGGAAIYGRLSVLQWIIRVFVLKVFCGMCYEKSELEPRLSYQEAVHLSPPTKSIE